MQSNKLGRTGLLVSELCLGTMTFGGGEGIWQKIGALQQAEAEKLVGRAIDAGINFLDTADVYAGGLSEQITGQALRNLKVPRDSVVVATKAFGQTGPGPNNRGNSRVHLIDAVKASLKRLQDNLDYHESGNYAEYFRYYMAQALFQGDYADWQKWNGEKIRELRDLQHEDGSFGGNYETGMSLLALALNYRFLPIYER